MGKALTFGSLFAGIGGFDLGFERSGLRCLWQVEIDEFCRGVLKKHWPSVERYGDVRECGRHNLAAVDVICGGFPCQPFSGAGKQEGEQDDRNLWPEMRRIVAELRPRWVVGENVPGIRNIYLDTVLSDLEGLDYTATTIDLPAVAFGAHHIRHRFFVVAYAKDAQPEQSSGSDRREGGRLAQVEPGAGAGSRSSRGSLAPRADVDRRTATQVSEALGDTKRAGLSQRQAQGQHGGIQPTERSSVEGGDTTVLDSPSTERGKQKTRDRGEMPSGRSEESRWQRQWLVEPDVGRMADGIPDRVDRLRALGNAVVPQVAEWIARRIIEVENG